MKKNKKPDLWSKFLTKSIKGPNVYYIIGTKRSIDYDYQGGHSFKYEIYDALDKYKIPFFKQSSGGSPGGHLTSEEIAYYFLDGGIVSSHMNVAHGCMGTWIIGVDALRFILYHFDDIIAPKKLKVESSIKTFDELKIELKKQLNDKDFLEVCAPELYVKYANHLLNEIYYYPTRAND